MNNEDRIIDLEIRFSHLDSFISELNSVVVAQQKTIELLEKALLDIKSNLHEGAVSPTRTLADDKPPHY